MNIVLIILFIFLGFAAIGTVSLILYLFLRSPFQYPYYTKTLDISGKRLPNIEDLIDEYLNTDGISEFSEHYKYLTTWKAACEERIKNAKLKKLRIEQYLKSIDDDNLFIFKLIRKQTRYRQINYIKNSYTVFVTVGTYSFNLKQLEQRYDKLSAIGFECTLSEYYSKEQRKRMTKTLREEIALRDNYTCQICGKYMPDGVGLHIDHIIPIAKGGKSIPSNLQVLCSKCNGKKSKN